VLHEFDRLKVPVLLMIGGHDTTAIGKDFSPPDVQARLGHVPELARDAANRMKQAKLIEYPDLSHAFFIQDPARFQRDLLKELAQQP
jgi:pimeloyl-ACP methyl ester carboxylesterase